MVSSFQRLYFLRKEEVQKKISTVFVFIGRSSPENFLSFLNYNVTFSQCYYTTALDSAWFTSTLTNRLFTQRASKILEPCVLELNKDFEKWKWVVKWKSRRLHLNVWDAMANWDYIFRKLNLFVWCKNCDRLPIFYLRNCCVKFCDEKSFLFFFNQFSKKEVICQDSCCFNSLWILGF